MSDNLRAAFLGCATTLVALLVGVLAHLFAQVIA